MAATIASQFMLLLCTAATARATLPAAPPLPRLPIPFRGSGQLPHLPFPFPGGIPHQFPGAESCVGDVLRSLASSSSACCVALQAVGDRCFRGVLPVSPFRALYAPLVKHACGELDLGLLVPGPGPRV